MLRHAEAFDRTASPFRHFRRILKILEIFGLRGFGHG
jgi:hypothetical protein